MTDEQRMFHDELAKRCGVKPSAMTLSDPMEAAGAEGHIVDVRYQPAVVGADAYWSVKLHNTAAVPMTVSHHADTWAEAFARCFRHADTLATDALANQAFGPIGGTS